MDRSGTEYAYSLSLTLLNLEPLGLDNDAEALDEEDATKDDQHQLLVDNQGTYTDDATDGQRSCIAHEYLGRIGVVPQETDHGPDESAKEDYKFLRMWDIHNVEVGRIDDMRRDVGEHHQGYTNDGRVASTILLAASLTTRVVLSVV